MSYDIDFPDINECVMAIANCSHDCINTVGSFQCSCRSGFTLNTDNKTCNGISFTFICCTYNVFHRY